MNKMKLIFQNNTISILIIYLCAISLSLEFIRLDLGYFTVSITSIAMLIFSGILSFLHGSTVVKNINQNKISISLLILFDSIVLISCFVNLNTHAIGIMIEWFILPIVSSVIVVSTLSKKEFSKNIWNAIILYTVSISVISLGSVLNLDFTYDGRLKSMWHSPNYLAMIISPMIPLVLWGIISLNDRMSRYSGLLILLAIFGILFATQSIFGVVSVFVGLFLLAPFIISIKHIKEHKKIFIVISIILTLGLSLLLVSRGSVFITNIERSSLMSRVNIWNVTKDLIGSESLKGYGLDTFQDKYLEKQEFYEPYLEWAVPSAHNTYLMLWFSGGFFMLFVFLVIYFFAIFNLIKRYLLLRDKKLILILVSILIIGIHGLVDTTIFGITISHIFWLLVIGAVISKNK